MRFPAAILCASVLCAVAVRASAGAIFTDRDSYAPGGRVYFTAAGAARGGKARAVLRAPDGKTAGDFTFKADVLGAVSGSFKIPDGASAGTFTLDLPKAGLKRALSVGRAPAAPAVEATPADAAPLRIAWREFKPHIQPGADVAWTLRVESPAGGPPAAAEIAAALCETAGPENGAAETEEKTFFFFSRRRVAADGTFSIKFKAPEKPSFWRLRIFAYDGESRTGALEEYGISTMPRPGDAPPFLRRGDTCGEYSCTNAPGIELLPSSPPEQASCAIPRLAQKYAAWEGILALEAMSRLEGDTAEALSACLEAAVLAAHFANADPAMRMMMGTWQNSPDAVKAGIGNMFDPARLEKATAEATERLAAARLPNGLWPWFPGGGADLKSSLAVFSCVAATARIAGRLPDVPLDGLDALDAIFCGGGPPPEATGLVAEYLRVRTALDGIVPVSAKHRAAFELLAAKPPQRPESGDPSSVSGREGASAMLARTAEKLLGKLIIMPDPPEHFPPPEAKPAVSGGTLNISLFGVCKEPEPGGNGVAVETKIAVSAAKPLERVIVRHERPACDVPAGERSGWRKAGALEFHVVRGISSDIVYIPRMPEGVHEITLESRRIYNGDFACGWAAAECADRPETRAVSEGWRDRIRR